MKILRISIVFILLNAVTACFILLFGQDSKSLIIENEDFALKEATKLYDNHLRRSTMVYTGRSYFDNKIGMRGHPFFEDDYWEIGSVKYDNYLYDSIYLMYDIFKDQLVVENFNADGFLSPITLYSKKVQSFDLMGYHFIRLEKDTTINMKEGFFNQTYCNDNLEVLIKRRKDIVNSTDAVSVANVYERRDRYYIRKDSVLHRVRKKRSILQVLFDHKKELKSFIRSNGFTFRINADQQLTEVVRYYDSLN